MTKSLLKVLALACIIICQFAVAFILLTYVVPPQSLLIAP